MRPPRGGAEGRRDVSAVLIYERFNALFQGALCWLPLIYLQETSLAYQAWRRGEAGVCRVRYEHHGTEALRLDPEMSL